ncbi:MAG: leucine-rich repeat domain-containing protein, partial [Desulfobacteraceae bacterium]
QISDISILKGLTQLQSLDLSYNQISDISILKGLTQLQSLVLSYNQISDISILKDLAQLQSLDLNGNPISDISILKGLTQLQSLNLVDNQISDISILKGLTQLQSLDLSYNQISDISILKVLTQLQSLNLIGNTISDISILKDLTQLQSLNLSGNPISDISIMKDLAQLQSLVLNDNQISDITTLKDLTQLQSLLLNGNLISDISILKELTQLQSIDLSYNQISDISILKDLAQLQSLNLSGNLISDISILKDLAQLQSLVLSDNQISDFTTLKDLTQLKSLNLTFNQISDISILKGLTQLKSLNLSYNLISDISILKYMTQLQSLVLSDNQIRDIKPILGLLKKGLSISYSFFDDINIGNNHVTSPPSAIIEEGREAIIDWFDQIKEGGGPLFETKLMILGQGGAGKTTFTELLLNPDYRVEPGKLDSTLGVIVHRGKEYSHATFSQKTIRAHLWDFGGQDIQKMLHQFFITEDCLYVLVSDKRAENTNFDYWFQIVHLLGPKSPIIVLENPKESASANENFPLTKYRELFKGLDIQCFEVNLKETKANDKTKWALLNETIEKKLSGLDIVNRPVPKKWSLIRDALVKAKKEKYITKDKYYEICAEPAIGLNKKHSDLCLIYLKSLGDLAFFSDRDLSTHIFLDHNWLTKGMYYILSDKQIHENGGRFTQDQAYQAWSRNGYNEMEKAMLLRLLLKDNFDICYELPDQKDVFITPLLLPSDKKEAWNHETNLYFRYQYGFMPHGLFSRLIVQLHEHIDDGKIWKTGLRLLDKSSGKPVMAEVQLQNDPDENQPVIDIKINGDKKGSKHLLSVIRTTIEKLHKAYNISCKSLVCCNCDECVRIMKKGGKPSFLLFDKLQEKIQNKRYFEECQNSNYALVNIGKILNDVVIENAGSDNNDAEFLHKLKESGISLNQIINNNKVEMSDFGKANATSASSAISESTSTATNTISIQIQTLLSETDLLKEDIERELKINGKMEEEEIKLAISDISVAESAIKEIQTAKIDNKDIPDKSKRRLQGFINDLANEDSILRKSLCMIRKGKDYGVKLTEAYNLLAPNIGLPSVPPFILEVAKKI